MLYKTSFLCILLTILLNVIGAADHSGTDPHVQCYNCVEGVDTGCGDKFDEESYKDEYLVECNTHRDKRGKSYRPYTAPNEDRPEFNYTAKMAVGCRKILQEIDGKTHVVRQCAFSGENVNGLKRTGNKGVRLYYYQCNDRPGCNSAPGKWSLSSTVGVAVVLIANLIKLLFCC